MAPKQRKNRKQTNPPLTRVIYLVVIIGLIAVFVIITLQSILSIIRDAF